MSADPLTLPETAGDYPDVPERSTAFLVGMMCGLLLAAVVAAILETLFR